MLSRLAIAFPESEYMKRVRSVAADLAPGAAEQIVEVHLVGALLKNEQDVSLFEKLVFMQRQNR